MKKILIYILTVVILLVGVFGIVGVEEANAQPTTGLTGAGAYNSTAGVLVRKAFAAVTNTVVNAAVYAIFTVSGLLVGIAGLLVNEVIRVTIIDMATMVGETSAIAEGWKIVRDVANMLFIFILLYISIATILRVQGYQAKQLLTKVIVAALLINFSLFFTRVVIDASNILTLAFYNPIASGYNVGQDGAVVVSPDGTSFTENPFSDVGFAGAFMAPLKLPTLWDASNLQEFKTVVFQSLGTVFLLVTAFAFFAIALLLIVRFIVFIVLMVTSPIAFIGPLLPATKPLADKWWKALFSQALFAPVFMLMSLVVVKIINDLNFLGQLTNQVDERGFASAFSGGSMIVVLNFIVVIGLMIASIVVAKSLASSSAGKLVDSTTKLGGKALLGSSAFIGRNVLGRAGRAAASEKTRVGRFLADKSGSSWFARQSLRGAVAASRGSFDVRGTAGFKGIAQTTGVDFGKASGKGGVEKSIEERAKKEKEFLKKYVGAPKKETADEKKKQEKNMNQLAKELSAPKIEEAREVGQDLKKADENLKEAKKRGANEAEIKKLSESVARAEVSFNALDEKQKSYANAMNSLAYAEKKGGKEKRAQQLKYAESRIGDTRFAYTKEANRRLRSELLKNKNERLLDDIKKLVEKPEEEGGGKEKPEDEENSGGTGGGGQTTEGNE